MISKDFLKSFAKTKNLNLGQAEKDYYQELILYILYQEFGRELVFKGGTALTKCYGFDRFSEDLDFTAEKKEYNDIITKGLSKFYLTFSTEEKSTKDTITITVKIQGPLFNGQLNSMCRIMLEFSLRDKTLLEPNIKRIGMHMEEVPMFDVISMSEEEIFAEKIRAIMTRNKARDLYDLYYLMKKGITPNIAVINKKLSIYEKTYSKNVFLKAVDEKQRIWNSEMRHLVKNAPKYNEVKKEIEKTLD
jgi:uncharacterized protein